MAAVPPPRPSAAQREEQIPVSTTTAREYRDTPVDVKLGLSALWIAMLFVFAYVDIFGFYRADVLNAVLDGKVATTEFTVDQVFLTLTLIYVLLPILMVVLTLLLKSRVNRITNIVVSLLYRSASSCRSSAKRGPTTSSEASSKWYCLPPSSDPPGHGRHLRLHRGCHNQPFAPSGATAR
jgi:hypothetical protein